MDGNHVVHVVYYSFRDVTKTKLTVIEEKDWIATRDAIGSDKITVKDTVGDEDKALLGLPTIEDQG